MRKRSFFSALLLLASGLASVAYAAKLGPGDTAPPLKVFRWVKGTPVTSFAPGKLYVVEFWATWCMPCKVSIPHLTELAKKYKGQVTFAGISISESPSQKPGGTDTSYLATVRKFVQAEGAKMNYNVGTDSPTAYLSRTWMDAAGQDGIPTAFVVKDAKVVWIGHPMVGLDEALSDMIAGHFDYAGERAREGKIAVEQEQEQADALLIKPYIAAMSARDYKQAIAEADKLMATHPEMKDDLVMAKFEALARSDPAAANDFAKSEASGDEKDKPVVLNSIAWAMVNDTEPLQGMDNALAESIAAQAVELFKPGTREYAETLDTLALAQFKCGKPGDATATEKRAIDLYSQRKDADAVTLKQMRARLKKYSKD